MADADVRDLEALEAFLVQLKTFQERLSKQVDETRSEMSTVNQWMSSLAPDYWKEQERVARRKWVEASDALMRCQSTTRSDEKPACREHRKLVDTWAARIRVCETKLRILRQAQAAWRTEAQTMQLKLQHLIDVVDARLPLARHHLNAKIEPLRQYAQMLAASAKPQGQSLQAQPYISNGAPESLPPEGSP